MFINAQGISEISRFITNNHIDGEPTMEALISWVRDAEYQAQHGNAAVIEIPAMYSSTGATVCYTVSDEGVE